MELGKKIRDLRKKRKMTLKELAEKSGLSVGMLSQIERDKIGLSVNSLWKISQALDMSIGSFFNQKLYPHKFIVRKDQRKKLQLVNSSASYELLTPDLSWNIEFLRIIIKPGESSDQQRITHQGEEVGLVLQGKLLVKWGEQEFILEEGDSIRLDSTVPHRYINIGDITSISIWAMTPPSF